MTRSEVSFSQVGRVGAGDPGLGPLPADAQPHQGLADRLAADRPVGQALGVGHLGGQAERPEAGGLAEVARAAVEQVAEPPPAGVVEGGRGSTWGARTSRAGRRGPRPRRRGWRCGRDWTQQPTAAAIALGLWPSALARRTWQRRRVNASGERRPARRACRSSSVRGRTKVGGFMPPIFARRDTLAQDLY